MTPPTALPASLCKCVICYRHGFGRHYSSFWRKCMRGGGWKQLFCDRVTAVNILPIHHVPLGRHCIYIRNIHSHTHTRARTQTCTHELTHIRGLGCTLSSDLVFLSCIFFVTFSASETKDQRHSWATERNNTSWGSTSNTGNLDKAVKGWWWVVKAERLKWCAARA